MSDARAYRWDDLPKDFPLDKIERRRIIGDNMMISEVRLQQGCFVPMHAHENEQIAMVVHGRLRFGVTGADGTTTDIEAGAGEVVHLPSNVPHSAEALEESLVLDLFSPPSEGTGIDQLGAEG